MHLREHRPALIEKSPSSCYCRNRRSSQLQGFSCICCTWQTWNASSNVHPPTTSL